MEIFGKTIPIGWIVTAVIVIVILVSILMLVFYLRRLVYQFKSSAWRLGWSMLEKVLREELKEDKIDFKEFNPEEELKQKDPDFDREVFLQMAEDCFQKYCKCMSTNDSRLLKTFETDSLFQKHHQVIEANKRERVKHIHNVYRYWGGSILKIEMGKSPRVKVEVRADVQRYRSDLSGYPLAGYVNDAKTEIYHLTFTKNFRKKDTNEETNQSVNCPNCGAPHQIHTAGFCEYCNTMIVVKKDSWQLSDLMKA